jgi:hypothetical protein
MSESEESGTRVSQGTISRRIVKPPANGSPGEAGVGIAYVSDARKGERFRIEQLWPDGSAEPVYVPEDLALELAREIMSHYEFEVVTDGE